MNKNFSRRHFLTTSAASMSMLPWLGASTSQAAEGQITVDENSPQAKALGYLHEASLVDLGKYPKRAGEDGQKQLCNNC